MALYKFLENHRAEILALSEEKAVKLAGSLFSSEELRRGLPVFYDQLIEFLKNTVVDSTQKEITTSAAAHGKELLRLHYTLSHVVHSYGALCQAITEYAQRKKANITSREFNDLNLCLDVAIASAVSEYQFLSNQASEDREVQHLGFLVHELRNALSSATIAHDMIKRGLVGIGGSTATVLGENLDRMRNLIDRSLSDVRMRADPELHIEKFYLNVLVDQILVTAQREARDKKQLLKNEIKAEVELETDRQLLLSAIANLIQNAIKYSKEGGTISVRSYASNGNVIIEIEDECGGIDPGKIENIFKPFVSGASDQSGLGLGLTIVQRAVILLQGKVSVRNNPGSGCAFLIEIPLELSPKSLSKIVSGEASVQPQSIKKPGSKL